jgi:hypothetical protein
VDTNPYEAPLASLNAASASEDDADVPRRRPAIGCFSLLLVAFVLFFGCAGLFARIESDEELGEIVIIDVLVGVAIVTIAILNSRGRNRKPRFLTRIVSAVAVAIVVSGLLIGWHCFTVHMRKQAIERLRQQQQESSESAR